MKPGRLGRAVVAAAATLLVAVAAPAAAQAQSAPVVMGGVTQPVFGYSDAIRERLWITAYTSDVSRYVVSKRLLGEGGYEVRNSLSAQVSFGEPDKIRPAVEDRIVAAVKSLLPESFRRR